MIKIKKYSNRKLYVTGASKFVTLKEIAELIKQGEKIQVIDVKTNEDITNNVLHKVLLHAKLNQDEIYNIIAQ